MRWATAISLCVALLGACKTNRPATPVSRAPAPPAAGSQPVSQPAVGPASRPAPPAAWKAALPLEDRGIFSELNPRVRLRVPDWLAAGPGLTVRTDRAELLYVAGVAVGFGRQSGWPVVRARLEGDADRDGIPDALDFLVGAKKTALNAAVYTEGYRRIPYPGGDVPRTEGVCTDVVVRALRNAGLDLQRLVHEDIRRAPAAYPMVRRPNAHIDHRRVRTLLPYFRRHWQRLPVDAGGEPLLPGDLVFLNTLGDARPDHLGIISDRRGRSGHPLVINNWTVGYRTAEMDLLGTVPATHRFRLPRRLPGADVAQRGVEGLMRRRGIKAIPSGHRQLVLVTVPLWNASAGTLRRYRRAEHGWRPVGRAVDVRIGASGLGRGRGLHGAGALSSGPAKREGDRRSPAGLFVLGTALGRGDKPYAGPWPWRSADARDRLVDDPASPHYNTWQRLPTQGEPAWRSAERLEVYRMALRVMHNTDPVKPGAGSAIFLHLHGAKPGPTVGCTALGRRDLLQVLGWLRPADRPLLLQVPGVVLPLQQ